MKKTPLLITIGIALLIATGYFIHERFIRQQPVIPWDLVPSDAIIVYEKDHCNACVDELSKSSTLWNIIESVAFYKKPVDSLRSRINSILKDKQGFLISAHVTKKDDFDLVYYLPHQVPIELFLELRGGNYKFSGREFNGIRINEIKISSQIFSFATIDNAWIGSFTPFLIEDVIRTHRAKPSAGFKKNISGSQVISSIKDDAGTIYIQLKNFTDWLSLFSNDGSLFNYELGKSAILDVKANENTTVLNGFSTDSIDRTKYMLSVFHHQSPVSFGLKHLISNRAVAVSSYGISDGKKFSTDLENFVKHQKPRLRDTVNLLSAAHKFKIGELYDLISDEIGVCFLESSKDRKLTKVLLIESRENSPWLKTFNGISEKFSVDTVFYEMYSQYEIREIPVYKFPEKIFWPLVTGFKQSFYTSIDNVILISDDLEELKNFLDDIEAEDTWGKSVSQNRFLESTLLESNVSLYFNPGKVWNLLMADLHPRWQFFVRDHQTLLQSLQMSSLQFSHLNNNYYTNVLFTYKPFVSSQAKSKIPGQKLIINFDQGIRTLYAVKSHINRSNEILVQDSLNDLSLISTEGKALWKVSIGDQITSEITQIDFFNNGKLQYFFSTPNAIHILDRLGNYVDPYPLYLSGTEIEHVSTLDYDNSKKYRILISDKKGKLWMFDKAGKKLEGWHPRDIGGSLAMAPRHHRIKGKDYIIAIRKDGIVYLMNRRGENLKKFPLKSESIPAGDYFLEVGNTIFDTYFVIISRDGFRIKFSPDGKIQHKEALTKTSVSSTFSLVSEKSNKSYLILQQDGKQLTVTDASGKVILVNNVVGIKPTDIQYFDFGNGNVFITLTDKSQGLCYVYDGEGNLLSSPPFEGSSIEIRPFNSEQFRVFFIHRKALTLQPL